MFVKAHLHCSLVSSVITADLMPVKNTSSFPFGDEFNSFRGLVDSVVCNVRSGSVACLFEAQNEWMLW